MLVEFTGSKIRIGDGNLKSHQTHQLAFWGFLHKEDNKDTLVFEGEDATIILQKVVNYFQKQKIEFTLSGKAGETLQELTKQTQDFESGKVQLAKFKDGVFDRNEFNKFIDFLKTKVKRNLKEHQEKAAYHLYLAKNGANFSVPGSGKTTVVLSVYEKLKEEGLVDTLFVVGPPAVFGPWKDEFEATLGREPSVQILAGGDKESRKLEYFPDQKGKSELYLSTFQTVLNDATDVASLLKTKHVKAFFVVDEAHYMKQLNGSWANALLDLAKFATYRCVLTGTPMPKSYGDIFNLFNFLWPENNPIDEYQTQKILSLEKEKNNEAVGEILEEKIGPLFYRVRKKDLGLTEQVFHDPVLLDMNEYERKIYDVIEHKIKEKSKLDDINDIELVLQLRRGRIIRLRQTVSYVGLLRTAIEGYNENLYEENSDIGKYIREYDHLELPAKVEHVLRMVEEFRDNNEKVLIWSNFVGTVELLKKLFTTKGLYCESIYGKTPIHKVLLSDEKNREEIRDEFVDPTSGLDILIANPAACAESISLHKTCHHAIYYDLSYNCAQYLQSLDRIHRVGGSEEVFAHYHFLQYKDTFESDIKENVEKKAEKMKALIDREYSVYNMDMFETEDNDAYERLFGKQN